MMSVLIAAWGAFALAVLAGCVVLADRLPRSPAQRQAAAPALMRGAAARGGVRDLMPPADRLPLRMAVRCRGLASAATVLLLASVAGVLAGIQVGLAVAP